MEQERPLDRRNRRWGSLRNSADLRVRLSQRAKAILSALRNREPEQISYGAVIEKLVEQHADVLEATDATLTTDDAEAHDPENAGTEFH
jgi:hypothetical protein